MVYIPAESRQSFSRMKFLYIIGEKIITTDIYQRSRVKAVWLFEKLFHFLYRRMCVGESINRTVKPDAFLHGCRIIILAAPLDKIAGHISGQDVIASE